MQRYRLSPSAAFAVLRRYSNRCNSKVVAVAEELITTASLPKLPTGLATAAPGQ
jgi:AmiR/NasT family two-component response regulator